MSTREAIQLHEAVKHDKQQSGEAPLAEQGWWSSKVNEDNDISEELVKEMLTAAGKSNNGQLTGLQQVGEKKEYYETQTVTQHISEHAASDKGRVGIRKTLIDKFVDDYYGEAAIERANRAWLLEGGTQDEFDRIQEEKDRIRREATLKDKRRDGTKAAESEQMNNADFTNKQKLGVDPDAFNKDKEVVRLMNLVNTKNMAPGEIPIWEAPRMEVMFKHENYNHLRGYNVGPDELHFGERNKALASDLHYGDRQKNDIHFMSKAKSYAEGAIARDQMGAHVANHDKFFDTKYDYNLLTTAERRIVHYADLTNLTVAQEKELAAVLSNLEDRKKHMLHQSRLMADSEIVRRSEEREHIAKIEADVERRYGRKQDKRTVVAEFLGRQVRVTPKQERMFPSKHEQDRLFHAEEEKKKKNAAKGTLTRGLGHARFNTGQVVEASIMDTETRQRRLSLTSEEKMEM